MVNKGLFTSQKDDWETPKDFFEKIDAHFDFEWDLAASNSNNKCSKFFTKENSALKEDWGGLNGWLWCNPPYGKELRHWVRKASESCANVVMLIPARTDTSYWHDYIFDKAKVVFLRGRLKFEINGEPKDAAPFPSALVIFKNKERKVND